MSIPGRETTELGTITVVAASVAAVAQKLFPPVASRSYWRVINLSSTGTLWCTKSPIITPAVGLAGCYPLAPGAVEEFAATGWIPLNGLTAISDGGTIQVTAETA